MFVIKILLSHKLLHMM